MRLIAVLLLNIALKTVCYSFVEYEDVEDEKERERERTIGERRWLRKRDIRGWRGRE